MKLMELENLVGGIKSMCLYDDKTDRLISDTPAKLLELFEYGEKEIKFIKFKTYIAVDDKPYIRAHVYLEI